MRVVGGLIKRAVVGMATTVVLAAVLGVPAASGEALSPWWGVTSGARPSSLRAGVGGDEIERLTVSATAGQFALEKSTSPVKFKLFAWDVSAQALRAGLEELYPGRRVEVSGGPGGEGGAYTITFPDQAGPVITLLSNAEIPFVGGEPLSGNKAEASVIVQSRGESTGAEIVVTAENRGEESTSGAVTIDDKLPAGLRAVEVESVAGASSGAAHRGEALCSLRFEHEVQCVFGGGLPPFEEIEVRIGVVVEPGAHTGEENTVSVAGGGATGTRTATHAIEVNGKEEFGVEDFQVIPENAGGSIDTQAGSHPFQLTSVVSLNSDTTDENGNPQTAALAKDIVSELPAGLIANPAPLVQCTDLQFDEHSETDGHIVNECPASSAVGVATVTFNDPGAQGLDTITAPIFNMEPAPGEPVRFGVKEEGLISGFLETSIRSGGDYGVTLTSANIAQTALLLSLKLTFWGVPGDRRHDNQRGWECLDNFGTCPTSTGEAPASFLALPTSCDAPFQSTVRASSWGSSARAEEQAEPVTYSLRGSSGEALSLDGCDHLPFAPEVTVTPEGAAASSPGGLNVDIHVPQPGATNPEDLAESAVRDITIALPAGVALNPAGANRLQACSESQIGFGGFEDLDGEIEPGARTAIFTGKLPEPLEQGINFCPNAAEIGTVKIQTPLLANPLEGAIYLATQDENPFGSLTAVYIVAKDPVSGVLVKLGGQSPWTPARVRSRRRSRTRRSCRSKTSISSSSVKNWRR